MNVFELSSVTVSYLTESPRTHLYISEERFLNWPTVEVFWLNKNCAQISLECEPNLSGIFHFSPFLHNELVPSKHKAITGLVGTWQHGSMAAWQHGNMAAW